MTDRAHTLCRLIVPLAARSAQRPKAAAAMYVWLAILAVAELAWLAWFLIVPLPNAKNVNTPPARAVRRGLPLLKTFPEVVPGTTFEESFLGNGQRAGATTSKTCPSLPILLACWSKSLLRRLALAMLLVPKLEFGLGAIERIALDCGSGRPDCSASSYLVAGTPGLAATLLFRGVALLVLAVVGLATSRLWARVLG